jgi:hypothetical protein
MRSESSSRGPNPLRKISGLFKIEWFLERNVQGLGDRLQVLGLTECPSPFDVASLPCGQTIASANAACFIPEIRRSSAMRFANRAVASGVAGVSEPRSRRPIIMYFATPRTAEGEVILWAVCWYCRYGISYRDLEQMMGERGVPVDHSTIYRWVQRCAPEIEKRLRWHWRRPRSTSWRVDETYVKVRGEWAYLYRVPDKHGNTTKRSTLTRPGVRRKRGVGKLL